MLWWGTADPQEIYDYEGNNLTSLESIDGIATYLYDEQYRLVSIDDPLLGTVNYSFDVAGNRLSQSNFSDNWQYNENDQLLAYSDVTFSYDENGNLSSKANTGGTILYFYDHENRLIRIEGGSGNVIARYYYDPFGKRLWKEIDGERIYYFYADEGLVGEYNATGVHLRSYGYEPGAVGTTNPVFIKVGSAYYFCQNDRLGKPLKIMDMSGTVVWSAHYDAYGTAQIDGSAGIINNFRLPGQYYDSETGLHYNHFRNYDPAIGRYLQADPLGMGNRPDIRKLLTNHSCMAGYSDVDINQYLYAEANPINMIDPFGTLSHGMGVSVEICKPIFVGVGIKIKGKMENVQCCNCKTYQMESMNTFEICGGVCFGVSLNLAIYYKAGRVNCCPGSSKKNNPQNPLKWSCTLGPHSISGDIIPKWLPVLTVTSYSIGIKGKIKDGLNLNIGGSLSRSASGCKSWSF